jgi:ribosomal protein S6--L-glutamate ligase
MILSYHPCFEGDKSLLCAGREPGADDLAAIKAADAVILPQGCRQSLYEMAHSNCTNVFPNFDARFNYPGKVGQARLFKEKRVAHSNTEIFLNLDAFSTHYGGFPEKSNLDFPFVFKFNWGGEGEQVYLIQSSSEFQNILQTAKSFEKSGHTGFVLQEYIPSQNRSLRVVVIGQTMTSYWRIQENAHRFGTHLAKGAVIDTESDPELQAAAMSSVKDFCILTGINLAGFDILFSQESKALFFLEINYHFGRRGLGGSEKFYETLIAEIKKWIDSLGLKRQ